MPEFLTRPLHRLLRRCGVDAHRLDPLRDPHLRRQRLLRLYAIERVIDGGAHHGEYAARLRQHGYSGGIESFEPDPDCFAALVRNSARDRRWQCHQLGLGASDGSATLHIAQSTVTNSLHTATTALLATVPGAAAGRQIEVAVASLDSLANGALAIDTATMLKLDIQGHELAALRGAEQALATIALVELELPLRPLYDGAANLPELWAFLLGHGFTAVSVEPNTLAANGAELLEINAVFGRAH